ncbi:50S ribosomal protein L17 [candidate division WOR-3 bacterium]|nr:50S ribosomal protein L17 [candidate division WOR-3 bacterium]
MRHKVKGRKLGRNDSNRKALLRNAASSLFLHGKIKTTKSIAKELQPYVEKIITKAKIDDFNARRYVARLVYGKETVKSLFDKVIPEMKEKKGGYTRIYGLDFRQGDNARMALIELSSYKEEKKEKKEKKPATRRGGRKAKKDDKDKEKEKNKK